MSATAYAEITKAVSDLIDKHVENDPTVVAYMIQRAAALQTRAMAGAERSAAVSIKIGREMLGGAR